MAGDLDWVADLEMRNRLKRALREAGLPWDDQQVHALMPLLGDVLDQLRDARAELEQIAQMVAGVPGVEEHTTTLGKVNAALQWIVLKSDDAYRELWRQRGLLGEAVDRG